MTNSQYRIYKRRGYVAIVAGVIFLGSGVFVSQIPHDVGVAIQAVGVVLAVFGLFVVWISAGEGFGPIF